jgi:DHA2 family multidrug resistance protein
MFFFMANLFGTLVMLPIYLQTLMGYTASLAGLVLAPGGVANLITMPVVGGSSTGTIPRPSSS